MGMVEKEDSILVLFRNTLFEQISCLLEVLLRDEVPIQSRTDRSQNSAITLMNVHVIDPFSPFHFWPLEQKCMAVARAAIATSQTVSQQKGKRKNSKGKLPTFSNRSSETSRSSIKIWICFTMPQSYLTTIHINNK